MSTPLHTMHIPVFRRGEERWTDECRIDWEGNRSLRHIEANYTGYASCEALHGVIRLLPDGTWEYWKWNDKRDALERDDCSSVVA